MADLCTDNRFELIEKYKQMLIDATNIETSPQEMAVIDNILFRFWQMRWLDRLEAEPVRHGSWIFNPKDAIEMMFTLPKCSECGAESSDGGNYCSYCGAKMDGERKEDDEKTD